MLGGETALVLGGAGDNLGGGLRGARELSDVGGPLAQVVVRLTSGGAWE